MNEAERIKQALEKLPDTWNDRHFSECDMIDLAVSLGTGFTADNLFEYIAACNPVAMRELLEEREHLRSALELAQTMCDKALPQFNWGASALDGEAIHLLNVTPGRIKAALEEIK